MRGTTVGALVLLLLASPLAEAAGEVTIEWDGPTTNVDWRGQAYVTADGTFEGTPVAVPGDRAERTAIIRNDGPSDAWVSAAVKNVAVHRADTSINTDLPEIIELGWSISGVEGTTTWAKAAETACEHAVVFPLPQGESFPATVIFAFPYDATGGRNGGEVSVSLTGELEVVMSDDPAPVRAAAAGCRVVEELTALPTPSAIPSPSPSPSATPAPTSSPSPALTPTQETTPSMPATGAPTMPATGSGTTMLFVIIAFVLALVGGSALGLSNRRYLSASGRDEVRRLAQRRAGWRASDFDRQPAGFSSVRIRRGGAGRWSRFGVIMFLVAIIASVSGPQSYALWSKTESLQIDDVVAGNLDLAIGESVWTVNNVAVEDITAVRLVPGDMAILNQRADLTVIGGGLKAVLGVTGAEIGGVGQLPSALTVSTAFTLLPTGAVAQADGTCLIDASTAVDHTVYGPIVATVIVTFDPNVTGLTGAAEVVDLSGITISLDQVRGV
ncbi:MAG: hypothetical protein LBM23_00085 [Propionibacteriaceae bacterium]|jgi:alternate signal-mediated exported protein|nr:hypothetical protein [Propionibacteriaceae bacterium]